MAPTRVWNFALITLCVTFWLKPDSTARDETARNPPRILPDETFSTADASHFWRENRQVLAVVEHKMREIFTHFA